MIMKKILIVIAFLLASACLNAQGTDLLQLILNTGAAVKSFESDLVNETLKTSGKNFKQSGKLYFVTNDRFAALFDTKELMIVNKNRMKIDVGLFHGRFRLNEGGMMSSLSNIFLYGFQGRCQELADENDYTITIQREKDWDYVVFDNNKKRPLIGLGYKKVIFKFDREDHRIREIKLFDYKDTIDTYTISNVKYNVKVDDKVFVF